MGRISGQGLSTPGCLLQAWPSALEPEETHGFRLLLSGEGRPANRLFLGRLWGKISFTSVQFKNTD